jgi:hypothetical protein
MHRTFQTWALTADEWSATGSGCLHSEKQSKVSTKRWAEPIWKQRPTLVQNGSWVNKIERQIQFLLIMVVSSVILAEILQQKNITHNDNNTFLYSWRKIL